MAIPPHKMCIGLFSLLGRSGIETGQISFEFSGLCPCNLHWPLQSSIKEMIMGRILVACLLSLYAINTSAADSSCSAQAAEKKLAGAAKTSFMSKCERDAKASCDATSGEKKL